MGIFDGAKAAAIGNKAVRTHVAGNELADSGKPSEAKVKYLEAARLYAESVRLGVQAPRVLESYVILLMREGDFDRAWTIMQDMEGKIKLNDNQRFQLLLSRSICLWRTDRLDDAIATIKSAGKLQMKGSVYTTLGVYLVEQAERTGEFDEAMAFNEKALDYDDEDAGVLDNIARLYELMSEDADRRDDAEATAEYRAKALEYYRKAHKLKPRQITTLYYLARLYHQDGDDARARKVLATKDTLYFTAICPVSRAMMDALAKEIG